MKTVPKGYDIFLKRKKEYISNEFYTPDYAITPLVKYLKEYEKKINKKLTIWCPFSLNKNFEFEDGIIPKSAYVRIFEENNFNVISSHIFENQDFMTYQPNEEYDIIIDNPPFKGRNNFFKRAISLNKPFLFFMIITCLNDKNPLNLFYQNNVEMEILFFNERTSFIKPDGEIHKRPPFSCGYIGTGGILSKQIIIEDIIDERKKYEKDYNFNKLI